MVEHASRMSVEDFERIASAVPETVTSEFVDGRIGEKAVLDGNRGMVVQWLTRLCVRHRPELWLNARPGLRVGVSRDERACPDGALAPSHAFAGQGEWADPAPVPMVLEVTSYDSDTDRRDREEKPRAYAEAGIPVYLLVDRDSCEVVVHSAPDGVRYERTLRAPFGKAVDLPEPVGITLDTEPLKTWVR